MIIEMFKNRIKKGVLKLNYNSYRNPWFLVKKKKKGKYRLINIIIEINRVIVRDANFPPSINEFFKKFTDYIIAFLIDFFSNYNQIKLNKKSRDLTTFHTPIKLLKITTLPQRTTNSVA